jgi:hypothetical protein
MKNRIAFCVLCFSIWAHTARAQEREYFQQKANYTIFVALDDTLHQLLGKAKIAYFNQSPDTLHEIYIHLWANGYRDRNTALVKQQINRGNTQLFFAKAKERGYIDHLNFKIDGKPVLFSFYQKQSDIAVINLTEPLLPGDSILIETPFLIKIPGDFSRMGHQDQAYQITQWYPKPAVYDREGWHPFSYLDLGEFYSEFGSFDVFITLPENYVVAATGVLVDNPDEENRIAQRIRDTKSGRFAKSNQIPVSSSRLKTLHFRQDSIHDFAWFADKRFLIAQKDVLFPRSGKTVQAFSYFLPEHYGVWNIVPDYIERSLLFYSEKLGEYPYSRCSAVDGALQAGGGMEYPMITVVNYFNDSKLTEHTVMHEVGHNWLYGILAFNERKYPWLDEGINSFYENEYLQKYYPNDLFLSDYALPKFLVKNKFPEFYTNYFAYLFTQSQHDYQPCGLPSEEYSAINYGASVYFTPVMMFRYLKAYLGEREFNKIMSQFAEEWSFKHPTPIDLRHFFEKKSGKKLEWFFDKLINTTTPIDMRLLSVKPVKGETGKFLVKTKDVSRLGAPYCITASDKNGMPLNEQWFSSSTGKNLDTISCPESVYKIEINRSLNIPEIDKRDNSMRIHGLFKRCDFPKFYFLWRVSNPSETHILYAPVVGWNLYNKWMFGMTVYSDPIVAPKFDYLLMPMYSFVTKTFTGMAEVGYTFSFPGVKTVRLGLLAKQYGYSFIGDLNQYQKVEPSLIIRFLSPANRNIDHQLKIRNVYICQTTKTPTLDSYKNATSSFEKQSEYSITDFHYKYANLRKINPWSVDADVQMMKKTIKLSAEIMTEYTYAKKKGVKLRLFAGKIYNPNTEFLPNLTLNASGIYETFTGSSDYLFDQTLIGRSETDGLWSHQMVGNDGGFATLTPLGRDNDWLFAANFSVDFPKKIPLSAFANLSTFSRAKDVLENGEMFIYEAGIRVNIIKNIFEIYVPLYISKDMQRVADLNQQHFIDRIRFKLNLNSLNPLKAVKRYKQIAL